MDCTLRNVVLHITDMCTSHCPYCYAGASDRCFSHADVNTLYKIVDALAETSVERVSLLGGDPALHPYAVDVAKYLTERGIKAGIMSNTMTFNHPFDEVVNYIDLYETTIHGRNAEEHDRFSGKKGAYDLLMSNLRHLSTFGERVTIGIAINVIPQTSDKIFGMVKSLLTNEEIKVDYIVLQRIIPFGRAENTDRYSLNKQNLEDALADVERVHEKLNINITVEDPFPLCAIDARYRKYMHECEWGFTKASLDGQGNLTRCGADTKHTLGNILETPLDVIWQTSSQLIAFREKKHLPASCHKCKLFDKCGGGCSLSCSSDEVDSPDYLMELYGGNPIL